MSWTDAYKERKFAWRDAMEVGLGATFFGSLFFGPCFAMAIWEKHRGNPEDALFFGLLGAGFLAIVVLWWILALLFAVGEAGGGRPRDPGSSVR